MKWELYCVLLFACGFFSFGCAHPASRGPVDPWVTGEECFTDLCVGCVDDCLAPVDAR